MLPTTAQHAGGLNVMCVDVSELLRHARAMEPAPAPPSLRPALAHPSRAHDRGGGGGGAYLIRGRAPGSSSGVPPLSPADPAVLAEVLRAAAEDPPTPRPPARVHSPSYRFPIQPRPPPPHLVPHRVPVTDPSRRRRGSGSPLMTLETFTATRRAQAAVQPQPQPQRAPSSPLFPSDSAGADADAAVSPSGWGGPVDRAAVRGAPPVLLRAAPSPGASSDAARSTPGPWSAQAMRETFRDRQLVAARQILAPPASPAPPAAAAAAAGSPAPSGCTSPALSTRGSAAPLGLPSPTHWTAPPLSRLQQPSAQQQRRVLRNAVLDAVRADVVAYDAARRSQRARDLEGSPAAVRQLRAAAATATAPMAAARMGEAEPALVPGPFRRHVRNPPTRRPKLRMVLDLFAGFAEGHARQRHRNGGSASANVSVSVSRDGAGNAAGRRRARNSDGASGFTVAADTEEARQLFTSCVSQVQRNLKSHAGSPSTLHTLASYYTRTEPRIEGRPFCVSLSHATFLFHMQMARVSVSDVELYVQLIANVLSQLTEEQQLRHPFVQQVVRDHVFGLPSPTCRGAAHCVVLVPPQQYRAFATMATALLALDIVPLDIVYQFQDQLEGYCGAASPIVANRALALLVQTVSEVRVDEQVTALQYVLRTKPVKMNVDFLLACYERLKRAVTDPAHGPSFGRALSIHCSELFLRFRSPVRREYVECFLYPSLCHPDMAGFLEIPATREHLLKELLALCTPGMSPSSPYYMCLCAMMQSSFDDEIDGALETVTLINCQMPHAAYFMSALAVDSHMSVAMFAKVIIALSRGAGLAMTGRDVPDEVASRISRSRTSVYNVLFVLREVVRSCSVTASRRATDMLKALRVAVPTTSIEALGKLSLEAFDGRCDITVDPQLLCAELAMVLHHDHIEAAAESAVEYFRNVTAQCHFCGMQRSAALLCPVNGTVHVSGQTSASRVLATLAECAGAKVLEERMIRYLRDPATQMDSATHFLLYHLLSHAGQHRNSFFVQLEPYIRSTLMALVSADRGSGRGLVSSEHKANVLMLHVKTVMLLSSAVDPSYLESILKVFGELKVRNNHDALALWLMGNLLLRNCKGNMDLLPTHPQENNHCIDFPGCAPSSATCADNAQHVLRLLDRAHRFSPETRKLVGCCVCKLIQDFNVQAPNIVMSLLSSYGFVPVGLPALAEFALPVGAGSTFWSFFLQQMKASAPARTAFMAALAKSMSRRFRIANPAEAIVPYGAEPTGHLFTVMMCEAMKRNPPLARVVLFMVSQWMRQGDHQPGKLVCLVYVCVQLVTAVVERGEGVAPVEMEAETAQDRHQFHDCAKKAAKLLSAQQARLERLVPAVRRDRNAAFLHLIRRIQRKVRRTVAVANGELAPGSTEPAPGDTEEPSAYGEGLDGGGYPEDDDVFDAGQPPPPQQHQQQQLPLPQQPFSSTLVALHELRNTADDSVFDDAAGPARRGAGGDEDDEYDAVGMEGTDTTYYGSGAPPGSGSSSATLVNSSGSYASAPQRMRGMATALEPPHPHKASAVYGQNASASSGEIASILKKHSQTTVTDAPASRGPTGVHRGASDPFPGEPSEVQVVDSGDDSVLDEVPRHPHPIARTGQRDDDRRAYRQPTQGQAGGHAPPPPPQQQQPQPQPQSQSQSRSQSRGVQTDWEGDEDGARDWAGRPHGAHPRSATERGMDAAVSRQREQQQQRQPQRYDKAVSAPASKSIGTSPIERASGKPGSSTAPPTTSATTVTGTTGSSSGSTTALAAPARDSASSDGAGRGSIWQEPDLEAYADGDETPIGATALPRLQATTSSDAGGVGLPSGMVLEYLRTHQAMDSLREEMNQLDRAAILTEVASYVQQYTVTSPAPALARHRPPQQPPLQQRLAVTVEGRANNYGAPHRSDGPAAGHTVVGPVMMVDTTPTAYHAPRLAAAGPQQEQPRAADAEVGEVAGDVIDGEAPVRAVSETVLSKRRRTEAEAAAAAAAAAVSNTAAMGAPVTPSHQLRGMNFFLNQRQLPGGAGEGAESSALQDLRFMQRQRAAMDSLAQQQQPQQQQQQRQRRPTRAEDEGTANQENMSPIGRANIAGEGLPQTTPYGQVVIPTCFVEQRNDTAVRELRQAMGAHNPNDTRLSTHGKHRIRGAGGPAGSADADNESTSSALWWSEMSAAPMPTYATDPQYSMELF